jgi:3D (Asp-Asp-Asp) domain-containing protein
MLAAMSVSAYVSYSLGVSRAASPPPPPQNITINYVQPPAAMMATVTAYTGRRSETNDDPGNTATMEPPVAGWTCAVSRDLIHWLGGRIYIKGIGVRRVNDLMNARFARSIDLYMGDLGNARQFGRQERTVTYLGR